MPRILLVIVAMCLSMLSYAKAAEPINIGALLPMTGSVAAFGQMAWDGINTAKQSNRKLLVALLRSSLLTPSRRKSIQLTLFQD